MQTLNDHPEIPFDDSYDGPEERWSNFSTCYRCGITFELNADNFYRDKYKPSGFSPWCKQCKNESTTERRRARGKGAKPARFACSICKDVRDVRWADDGSVCTCKTCNRVLAMILDGDSTDQGIEAAEAFYQAVVDHNVWVEQRSAASRSDRFIPHPDRRWVSYPAWDHRDCVRLEESVRRVVEVMRVEGC